MIPVNEMWLQCEGQVVDGIFPLRQFLGAGREGAVFRTEYASEAAAIKLVPARPQTAELQLARWREAARFSHPHLVRLFRQGRTEVDGRPFLYVVMEHADEVLSDVLSGRALTEAEAREMLGPVLDLLAWLHSQGFVHGHLKPSNLLAIQDQLKLASDGISREGLASDDLYGLGLTMLEVLTQQRDPAAAASLSEPLRGLVRQCLRRKGTVAQLQERLARPTAASRVRRFGPVGVVAVVAGLTAVVVMFRSPAPEPPPQTAAVAPAATPKVQPQAQPPAPEPETLVTEEPKAERKKKDRKKADRQKPETAQAAPAAPEQTQPAAPSSVVNEALPDVIPQARQSIQGRLRVSVRVHVDAGGNVVEAELDSASPSKYFASAALRAARQWKFAPAVSPGNWVLRFEFTRTSTTATASQLKPL